jgi:hypothetical protein
MLIELNAAVASVSWFDACSLLWGDLIVEKSSAADSEVFRFN